MRGLLFDGMYVEIDERSVSRGGSWNPDATAYGPGVLAEVWNTCQHLPNPVVLDIGANSGGACLLAAHHPGMLVYAWEPDQESFEILCANIEANDLDSRTTVYNVALSNRAGNAWLHTPLQSGLSGLARLSEFSGSARRTLVPLWTLDDWAQNKPKIDVIKLDVEGHELSVLCGAEQTLQRDHPMLIVEYPTQQDADDPVDIWEWLEARDYTCRMIEHDLVAEYHD